MKIHNIKFNNYFIPLILFAISIGGLFLFQALTYTPELSHAESVTHRPTLANITYMQDITPEVCTNTPEADAMGKYQYQLIDKRDNKTYWVAKLRDGNCWMTQNLDLDLSTTEKLTDELTDTTSAGYTPPKNTQQDQITELPHSNSFSYNPGEYVYTTPTVQSSCNKNKVDGCPNWTLITGLSSDNSNDERAHYLVGNYYSFDMATIETSTGLDAITTNYSICPRGWKLPIGHSDTTDRSFGNLLLSYGSHESGSTIYGTQDIRLAPLYFLYGGSVFYDRFAHLSNRGWYWSATSSNSYAYLLQFSSSTVLPNYSYHRSFGMSIRCVANSKEKRQTNNTEIIINPTISLDVTNEIAIEKNKANPSTANLDVKVNSNQSYTIGISTTEPNLTSSTSNVTIPVKSGLLNTAENGWGIKLKDNTNYTALTTSLQTFYTASGAEIKTIPFIIGISTAPDIPNGEYSTDVTVTATQN